MSKMIPLKIADMAVESCNKEIARLLFEKAELQGRVIALEAQLESEKAAYKALRASSFVTAVPVEEYEKLKAEVERLTKLCQATSPDGFVHVRDIKHHTIMGPAWEERQKVANLIPPIVESNAIPEGQAVLVNIYQHQQDAEEIKRLKAEVERLRKAGDALVDEGESLARDVSFVTSVWDNRVADWNAAKEGKQS